jgi:hypothetical protein
VSGLRKTKIPSTPPRVQVLPDAMLARAFAVRGDTSRLRRFAAKLIAGAHERGGGGMGAPCVVPE